MNNQTSHQKGVLGEKVAGEYLLSSGYKIIANRYKTKWGEVDIIASRRDKIVCKHLHFIEVKHKVKEVNFNNFPVSQRSMRRIAESAQIFLQKNESYLEHQMQFDIIIVNPHTGKLQHMENIYYA